MYIFHLVLCYDMICFFVASINIYLTFDFDFESWVVPLIVCLQGAIKILGL